MIGNTLSHYKIIEKLGQGGMGEVYLAEDSRLDRKVALKILPEHLSDRAELRERFEREARAVSSLNHPHICTLYDIGEQDGIHYLVMEHLVGETLEARLTKGPLPLEKTLEYAIQIADALDKAHRQGVVHRDLKPGNIMLVKSGAKLLDFGLAKLQAAETPTNLSALPTEQANLTAEGTILGTLQYMAPEQLEAKEADSRTDIFAFGAVVYEMATGKKAFEGKSQASLIAAIMGQTPSPISELQPMTPSVLDWVVKRCLAKEPDERWQSATDLMAGLMRTADVGAEAGPSPHFTEPSPWKRAIPWSLASLVVGIIVTLIVVWNLRLQPQAEITRLGFALPPGDQFSSFNPRSAVTISPDGRTVVYVGEQNGLRQLYRRPLSSQDDPEPIPGTGLAQEPFFSPDGRWVGFFAGGELKKILLEGGTAQPLTRVPVFSEATWTPDDTIIFGDATGLFRIGADGEDLTQLTTTNESQLEEIHVRPQVLPDGEHVLFTIIHPHSTSQIAVQSMAGGDPVPLIDGRGARLSPTGHLIFGRANSLLAIPFDPDTRRTVGQAEPILDGVQVDGSGTPQFALAADGTLAYIPAGSFDEGTVVLVDRSGNVVQELYEVTTNTYLPRFSPDGRYVLIQIMDPITQRFDIWRFDTVRGDRTPLTSSETSASLPVWSPDGDRFAFRALSEIKVMATDGSSESQTLLPLERKTWPSSWRGQWLALSEKHAATGWNAVVVSLDDQSRVEIGEDLSNSNFPMLSPDGRWVAYHTEVGDRYEVYVRALLEGEEYPISVDGGTGPVWSRDGRQLYYSRGKQMMVVDIDPSDGLDVSPPRQLFSGPFRMGFPNYDVSPDGERFVMVRYGEESIPRINVVQNWFEELKRLVPTDN